MSDIKNDEFDFAEDFADLNENSIQEEALETEETVVNPHEANFNWYIIQTVSGYEQKAYTLLEAALKDSDYRDYFGQMIIPVETVITRTGSKVRKSERKLFPSYIFIQMEMNFTTLNLVRGVTHVLGFVGHQKGKQPEPMKKSELEKILKLVKDSEISPKETIKFKAGDLVIIKRDDFKNYEGEVVSVNTGAVPGEDKVSVALSFMGARRIIELKASEVDIAPASK
ncbi:transcription termination/antitermination protein NusG [Psittacicella gerlachiana]|uniref:Transcription termination/antitermination protein NusG n=1 Tax=Psittacicella gerlachiana TaxID=2028574 RepID=A0A3A1YCC4_9GAMM|nr:transcription termination/antitermination protein NusG [Psittacicella gerlachiana]RIY34869.1 hypothetical protein CKF59_04540 [Psittacicella gerlachiana]